MLLPLLETRYWRHIPTIFLRPSSSIPCESIKRECSRLHSIRNLQILSRLGHQPLEHVHHLDYKGRCLLKSLYLSVSPSASLSLSQSTEQFLIIHSFIPERTNFFVGLLSRSAFQEIQSLHVFSLALCMDITTSQKRTGDLLHYMMPR